MLPKSFTETPIVFRADPITNAQIHRFAAATSSTHFTDTLLTFPTTFRAAEFQWMDRLKIDMRELLHTDQEYEFHSALKEGDTPTIYTRMQEYKERRGLTFVALESEIRCGDRLAIVTRSAFVLRKAGETPSP